MKKVLLFILLLPMYVTIHAQVFHIGLEGSRHLNGGGYDSDYWQGAVIGSYTHKLPCVFSFDVNASLYYQSYDSYKIVSIPSLDWTPPSGKGWDTYQRSIGGTVGVNGIIKIYGPISAFTGPRLICHFLKTAYPEHYCAEYNWHDCAVQWRVGLSADVWRLRVRVSWDIYMTGITIMDKSSDISFSLAYRL